jgi:hypothetical protein
MGGIIKRGTVYPSGALVALSLVICVVFGILLLFVQKIQWANVKGQIIIICQTPHR